MFDKKEFANILIKISSLYENQRDFSKKSDINRTYLSQYMNMKLEKPPKPETLMKLANASYGIITYESLMIVCGYTVFEKLNTETVNVIAYNSELNYNDMKKTFNSLLLMNFNNQELKNIATAFSNCCNYIINSQNHINPKKPLSHFKFNLSDTEKKGFNLLYIFLLKRLRSYSNVPRKKDEIFSLKKHLILNEDDKDIKLCIDIINGIREYFYNSITETIINTQLNQKIHMIPVYGRISAGQPNWAEECIEGRLPIDTNLMNILNPEECFFLRVNGESMNRIIKNGAYALIRKTDFVNNGEIAVVLVNGFDATLKKFSKKGEMIILEPQSTDETIETQFYDKNTEVKVIGKYIGKMELK